MDCMHEWQPDPDNIMYSDCRLCGAILKTHDYCPVCGGRKWVEAGFHDDPLGGVKPIYRAPCGHCEASGLVPLDPPRII